MTDGPDVFELIVSFNICAFIDLEELIVFLVDSLDEFPKLLDIALESRNQVRA